MTIYEMLTVANFGLTLAIMAMLSVSLMPHFKQGMVLVRDAVLWAAMVVLICFVLAAAWYRFQGGLLGTAAEPTAEFDRPSPVARDLLVER